MVEKNSVMPPKDKTFLSTEILDLQKTLEEGKTVIGIDIGVSSVNVAQTALHHGRPTLIKVAVEDIALVNERERDTAALEALKRALSKFNTRLADIICVLPSSQTVIETIVMPVMPLEELAEAIKLEVSSSPHFVLDRPVVDFKVIGRVADKGVQKVNVLVAAAPKTAVDDLLANFIVQQAKPLAGFDRVISNPVGINVDAVVPLSVALENIMMKSKLRMDETMAVIEMGTIATELNVYRNSQLEYSRKIPVTGYDFTRSLTTALSTSAGKLELTIEMAEDIKKEYGIPAPGENFLIQGKITSGQVLSLLRPKLEQLASEISRSFDYYQEKMRSGRVDRIIIFGGGARLKGLPEFLNAELGLPVALGNPVQDVELLYDGVLPNRDDAQRLVEAIGASLGDIKGINLVPAPLKERKKRSFERLVFVGGAIAFLTVLSAFYFITMARTNWAKARVQVAMKECQSLEPKLQELKNGLLLRKMVRNRPDLGGFIKQLSYLPSYVYLTKLDFKGGKVDMAGFVVGADKGVREVAEQLAEDFGKGIMPDARVLPGQKTVPGKAADLFQIQGRLGSGGGTR